MNKYFKQIETTTLILFLSMSVLFGQNNKLKTIENLLNNGDTKKAISELNHLKPILTSSKDIAKFYFLNAKYYELINDDKNAFKNYLASKNKYIQLNELDNAMEINYNIAFLLSCYQNNANYKPYIKEYLDYALDSKDNHKILKAYIQVASLKINKENLKESQESLIYFHKALALNKKVNDENQASKLYNNLSVLYSDVFMKSDSSLYYLKKDYEIISKKNDSLSICINLMNQAANYYHLKQFNQAVELLKKANDINLKKFKKENKGNIHKFLYKNYKELKKFDFALAHYELFNDYQDSINKKEQEKLIKELDVKYQTQKKELQIANFKAEQIMNYSIIGFLIIVVTTSILAYQNLSKKKKIIEQEKQLETQKLETTLKEQELHEIDVMLESQEKERQRIANELHDNLGSMLATLKLNFENLKRHDTDSGDKEAQLFKKTDSLIDEAYQKVRNISHLKNLGVIGSEGLVVAVKKMAEKMSVLNKLQINVIPHGLNERLENTLEVTLFRIIQELCTNIIKHSEATEVNINLTQYGTSELNIIVEDNGKGFDSKNIVSTSGIGLKNIEKKIEQMNGTFTIDSNISVGTSIIIDLPI